MFSNLFNPAKEEATRLSEKATQMARPLSLAKETVKETIAEPIKLFKKGFWSVGNEVKPKPLDAFKDSPFVGLKEAGKSIADVFKDTAGRVEEWGAAISDPESSLTKKLAKTGGVGVGAVNNLFSLVNAPLVALSPVPGIGYFADSVQALFAGIGNIGSGTADSLLNDVPISEKTREELRPLVKELGALAALAATGKLTGDVVTKIKGKTIEISDKIKDDVAVQIKIHEEHPQTTKIPIRTPNTKHTEYARSMGYEPYQAPETLPIIQFGKREKGELPEIQVGTKEKQAPVPKGTRLVPEEKPMFSDLFKEPEIRPVDVPLPRQSFVAELVESPIKATEVVDRPVPTGEPAPLMQPVGAGELKTPKLTEGVIANAIERDLITSGDLEHPQYRTANMKQQAQAAEQFVRTNPSEALRVAEGKSPAPEGIIPSMIFNAVEALISRTGDGAMLARLVKGEMGRAGSAAGQFIRGFGERDVLSPVRTVTNIEKARATNYEKRTGKKPEKAEAEEVKSMKKNIKKSASSRQDWEDFIREISCN